MLILGLEERENTEYETTSEMETGTESLEQLTKKVVKGGSIFFAGSIFGQGINFALHILLARMLGSGSYGLYALGHSAVTITSRFSMLGLQNGVVRFVSLYNGIGDTKKVKGTLVSAFAGATTFSIVISILLFTFSDSISVELFNKSNLSNVLRVFSISLPFCVLMTMVSYSARAFQAMKYEVGVSNISFPILNLISVSVAFLLGFKLLGAIYAFLISAFSSFLLGLYFIKRIFPEVIELQPSYEFRRLLRFSAPVFLIGFSYVILSHIDRIMIGYFMNSSDVGIYNAAVNIVLLAELILSSVNAIFSPIISDLYNRNKLKELENLFKISTRWIFTLTLPVILIMIISSKEILGSSFGVGFTDGWIVLVTLSVSKIITTGTGSVGFILQMTGKQDIELVNTVITVMMNIGLNIWFIQSYGVFGAALATGISLTVINIAKLIEVYKLIGIQPYNRKYIKPIIAAVLGVLVSLLFNSIEEIVVSSWIASIVIFSVIYSTFLLVLGLEKQDKILFRGILRKIGVK